MVVAAAILSVGREETTVVWSLEGHSEIICFRIEGIAGMLYLILLGLFVYSGNVDVETAHSDMAVTAEIEVAVRAEGREHLVARRIDGGTEVFHTSQT